MAVSRYIPRGSVKISDRLSDAVAYIYTTSKGRAGWMIYFGTQSKPVANYASDDEKRRTQHIVKKFGERQRSLASKTERRAERAAYRNDYKVGEILVCSWGYDQTNVDWYEVVAVRGQLVDIRRIAKKYIETGVYSGHCAPLPGDFTSDVITKRSGEYGLRMEHGRASIAPYDLRAGVKVYQPRYESHYA